MLVSGVTEREEAMSRSSYSVRLLRTLSPILISFIIYQIDFWGFGMLFFERTPSISETILVWFIVALIRAGMGVFALSLVRGQSWKKVLNKNALMLSYFVVGLPMITTHMSIHRILDVSVYPDPLERILPLHIIEGFTRGLAYKWFEAYGIPYDVYLLPYTFLIEPLFTELPRLLLFIIFVRALGFSRVAMTDSGLPP